MSATRELRLKLVDQPGTNSLDGGWWPYSRDLVHEMTDLVRLFPEGPGWITSAVYSRPDWDGAPRRVDLGTRVVKIGSFPDEDTHVLVVRTKDDEQLTLLVIPPAFTQMQGEEALLAASTPGNSHTGAEVLWEVTDDDGDSPAQWTRAEDGTPHRLGETAPN